MRRTIKRTYVRRYRDNGQIVAYVDWSDGSRTESTLRTFTARRSRVFRTFGEHMHALFNRARREGLTLQRETW